MNLLPSSSVKNSHQNYNSYIEDLSILLKESSEEETEDLVCSGKDKKSDNEIGDDMMTDVSGLRS